MLSAQGIRLVSAAKSFGYGFDTMAWCDAIAIPMGSDAEQYVGNIPELLGLPDLQCKVVEIKGCEVVIAWLPQVEPAEGKGVQ